MADFKKNITNITKKDRDKYFQLPSKLGNHFKKQNVDKSIEGVKKRLEEQLETRKKYVFLLEEQEKALDVYIESPTEENRKLLEVKKAMVEKHNLHIEITAQQNVFLDTYIYYKEDFLKRYKNEKGKKQSVFTHINKHKKRK